MATSDDNKRPKRRYCKEVDPGPDFDAPPRKLQPYEDIDIGICPGCLVERRLYRPFVAEGYIPVVDPSKEGRCSVCVRRAVT